VPGGLPTATAFSPQAHVPLQEPLARQQQQQQQQQQWQHPMPVTKSPNPFKSPFGEAPSSAPGTDSFASSHTTDTTASGASASGALASHLQQQLSISRNGSCGLGPGQGMGMMEGGRTSPAHCSAELLAS
jgi:hypothetical protein